MTKTLLDWRVSDRHPQALLLHTHPDDETIFAGGLLLSYPFWRWTIVCMTLQDSAPERLNEFKTAMESFKGFGVKIERFLSLKKFDSGNPWDKLTKEQKADWIESVKKLKLTPDIVFSHNSKGGEYGNFQHMETGKVALSLFNNVWEFVYPGKTTVCDLPQPVKAKLNKVELSKDTLAKKRAIFEKAYLAQAPGLWKDLEELLDYELYKGPEIFTSN